jgi:hypothetical protein
MTMTTEHTVTPLPIDAAPSPERSPVDLRVRRGKRLRARARVEAAQRLRPSLRIDRLSPIFNILRTYREHAPGAPEPSPLIAYVKELTAEIETLEAWAGERTRRAQSEGAVIRQALEFLRTFGRVGALDFSVVPIEDRAMLVSLLALEHRWCYAAAGTTRDVFKIAIGRTGAR